MRLLYGGASQSSKTKLVPVEESTYDLEYGLNRENSMASRAMSDFEEQLRITGNGEITNEVERKLADLRKNVEKVLLSAPKATTAERLGDDIWFRGKEIFSEYKDFQKMQLEPFFILPMCALCFTVLVTRGNLQAFGSDSPHYCFTLSVLIAIFLSSALALYLPASFVIYFHRRSEDARQPWYVKYAHRILRTWFFGRIEDAIGILGTLYGCLDILGRVFEGQCPPNVSYWDSQACNPVANAGSFPMEHTVIIMSFPIVCQALLKGIMLQTVATQFACILATMIYCAVRVKGQYEIMTVLESILFWNVALEFERRMRTMFLQFKSIKESKEREKHMALEVAVVFSETEMRLKDAEKQQLRSLMGNVAHDLKTPLHSFTADLEVLRSITAGVKKGTMSVETSIKESTSTYDNLEATSKFMLMAINRGLDYVKASSNFELVPANESFVLAPALSLAVNCVEHLQSGRTVNVHELPAGICSHVITDKHWLTENVMCLLSNAVKYSPASATVDLKLELLTGQLPEEYRNSRQKSAPSSIHNSIHMDLCSLSDAADAANTAATRKGEGGVENRNESDAVLLVTVEDKGIGIDGGVRGRLFQPFKQAQRMAGGTGLGLFSLRKRVEALGGACGVLERSDGSQGSRFWFTIPYRPDPESAAAMAGENSPRNEFDRLGSPRERPRPQDTTVNTVNTVNNTSGDAVVSAKSDSLISPSHILVVDDTHTILKVASRTLKMSGHSVETAENGVQSLERMQRAYDAGEIDVVLTDLQMPVMDGIEATRRYRQYESEKLSASGKDAVAGSGRRLIIIGMSANSDSQTAEEACKAGMDGFIGKPFNYKDFEKTLMNAKGV